METQSKTCLASEIQLPTHIGSHGLRKRIIQNGISWQTPFPGDEVQVHYRGKVDGGESLYSSYDKRTPFNFKLGQCEVIRGWDEGIATMHKGEAAEFTIPPNLAYGQCGCPPLIPSNATLIFEVELLSWCTVRDLKCDGGVLKKVKIEGSGWATPKDPDQVSINYEVKLESGITLLKNSNVEYYLHEGHLCPAISIALTTMRRGERAELTVRFPYGITKEVSGCGEVILPDSYLTFHIELLSWKKVVDIAGDKKILKKITKAGEGLDQPNEGSLAKVIYNWQCEDGTVMERKGTVEQPFEYTCMGGRINESLDRAILTMRKGEHATVSIHGASAAAPGSTVTFYEVELVDFTKDKPLWKMDTLEKIQASEKTKCEGNELFKSGRLLLASSKYEKAAKYLEFDHSFTEEEKRRADALRVSCYINNAACKLKINELLGAAKQCTKALEVDPDNVKALYRRCKAYLRANEFEKAETDIRKALLIDPNDRDVKIAYREVIEKRKEHSICEAQIFSSMLARMQYYKI
ncbi:hypothetical protein QQ045_029969 [Rhodiola kirilowii]